MPNFSTLDPDYFLGQGHQPEIFTTDQGQFWVRIKRVDWRAVGCGVQSCAYERKVSRRTAGTNGVRCVTICIKRATEASTPA